MATKVEAFKSRGHGDFLTSRDFADVIVLVDGREELVAEVLKAASELRAYLAEELTSLMEAPRLLDGVFAALRGDPASQARAEAVVMSRLQEMCAASSA